MSKRYISGEAYIKSYMDDDEFASYKKLMNYVDEMTAEFKSQGIKNIDNVDGFDDTGDPEVDKLQVNIIKLYQLRINRNTLTLDYDEVKKLLVVRKKWDAPP